MDVFYIDSTNVKVYMVKRGNNLMLYKYSLILTEFVFYLLNLFVKSTQVQTRHNRTHRNRPIFPQSLLVCWNCTSDWLLTSLCRARLLHPLILYLAVHHRRAASLVAKLAPSLRGCVGFQFDFQLRSGCGACEDSNRQTKFHKSHLLESGF